MNDSMPVDDEPDVIIVGGGVAGVSCALECFDIQLATEVFETDARPGGQLADIPHSVRNLAAGRFENGPAVRDALEEAAAILGPHLRLSQAVTRVDVAGRWVEVDGRRVHARALVLATGTSWQQLPAAPDGAFSGAVTYQLDAANRDQFAGRDVVVIGGGDSGTLDALELARTGSAVTLVHRSSGLSARHDIVEQIRKERRIDDLAGWELDGLHGGEHLEEVVLRRPDGARRRLAAQGLVVKIARAPRTQLVRGQLEARPSQRHRGRRRATHLGPRCVRRRRRRGRCVRAGRGGHRAGQPGGAIGAALPAGTIVTPSPDVPAPGTVVAYFQQALHEGIPTPSSGVLRLLSELHRNNLDQWQCEDLTRAPDADDATVAAAKRDIDTLNGHRHVLVEAIDAALAAAIRQEPSAAPVTESPAMVFDRLSVLTIRIHFTEHAARSPSTDRAAYRARLPLLRDHLTVVVEALEGLFDDIGSGRKRFVPYQSFKLYGSPAD